MKEIFKNFLESSRERLKNPIVGSFIISFILLNWKPILILLTSPLYINENITIIEDKHTGLKYNLILPLVISIIYIIVLPYLTWLFEALSYKAIIGRKKNAISQQLIDIINKQKIAQEESKLEYIKANYRETADLNKKIETLSKQVDERDTTISELTTKLNLSIEQKDEIEQVLNEISQKDSTIEYEKEYQEFKDSDIYRYFEGIGKEIKSGEQISFLKDEMVLEKYLQSEIFYQYNTHIKDTIYYKFTEKGKYFWKKYILELELKH